MEVPFSKINELPPSTSMRQHYNVIKTDEDTSALKIVIRNNGIYTFDPSLTFQCNRISIEGNVDVTLTGLRLNGMIQVYHSKLKLQYSHIYKPAAGVDYLLIAEQNSSVSVDKCEFYDTQLYGVAADASSYLTITNSLIKNCDECPLSATGNSTIDAKDCTIDTTKSELSIADTHSGFAFTRVTFKNSQHSAVFIQNDSSANITDCTFLDNLKGAINVRDATSTKMTNCEIINSNDTAILLDNGSTVVENVHIRRCNGNCVNASAHSSAIIKNCHFEESQWPVCAFCDQSSGVVKNCLFEKSLMSGFIVRSSPHLHVEDVVIRSCAETGLRLSDSTNCKFVRCMIGDVQYHSVEICDRSDVTLEDCVVAGGATNGIGVFTGSRLKAFGTAIIGPFESCVWVHHGASALFEQTVIAPSPSPIAWNLWSAFAGAARARMVAERDTRYVSERYKGDPLKYIHDENSISLPSTKYENDRRFFRVDGKYSVEALNTYIVGVGFYEFHANSLTELENDTLELPHCIECGEQKKCLHFSPCGHTLYCADCWAKIEHPKLCHLCHLPVEKAVSPLYQGSEDEKLCAICYTNDVDSIILACGHTICRECNKRWFREHMECPFCRDQRVQVRAFVPYD